MSEAGQPSFRCSFCKKTQDEVRKLISGRDADGHDVYICDECVDLCNDIIFGEVPSVIRPLRMAWRALRLRMTGRWPPNEDPPSKPNRDA
jgi:hypothetical protein